MNAITIPEKTLQAAAKFGGVVLTLNHSSHACHLPHLKWTEFMRCEPMEGKRK